MAKEKNIWSNLDINFDDWRDGWEDYLEMNCLNKEEYGEQEFHEWVWETLDIYLDDEHSNLNKEVDGVIVCLASVGTWMGARDAYKEIGNNVRDILYSNCGLCKWYCDRWNVRSVQAHHDGRNYLLYRVAESKEKAEWIEEMFLRGKIDEKRFMRHTKSLRPYVAKVYGW